MIQQINIETHTEPRYNRYGEYEGERPGDGLCTVKIEAVCTLEEALTLRDIAMHRRQWAVPTKETAPVAPELVAGHPALPPAPIEAEFIDEDEP